MDPTLAGEIEPGLWVGGLGAVKEIRHCPGRPWTVVSALKAEKLSLFLTTTLQEIHDAHPDMVIHHELWDIADQSQSDFLSERLEHVLCQIDERILDQSGCCLVHCAFGVSRSVAICAAWLISRRHLSLSTALQRIRAVREDAAPNMGFIAALRALEQCDGNVAAALQRMAERNCGQTSKQAIIPAKGLKRVRPELWSICNCAECEAFIEAMRQAQDATGSGNEVVVGGENDVDGDGPLAPGLVSTTQH